MKTIISVSLSLFAIAALFVAGMSQPAGAAAPPSSKYYTLGPFEAVGYGVVESEAADEAYSEMADMIYGAGGIVDNLPQGHALAFETVVSENYDSPEYEIVFTVTIFRPGRSRL